MCSRWIKWLYLDRAISTIWTISAQVLVSRIWEVQDSPLLLIPLVGEPTEWKWLRIEHDLGEVERTQWKNGGSSRGSFASGKVRMTAVAGVVSARIFQGRTGGVWTGWVSNEESHAFKKDHEQNFGWWVACVGRGGTIFRWIAHYGGTSQRKGGSSSIEHSDGIGVIRNAHRYGISSMDHDRLQEHVVVTSGLDGNIELTMHLDFKRELSSTD